MENNANPCGESSNHCCHLSKVQEIAAKLTYVDFAKWCVLPAPHCQVYELNMDIFVVYYPSLILQ
jgi:hypothetical protein